MTLDETIKHAEEVADTKLQDAELSEIQGCYNNAKKCYACAEEHRQLVEWLKDYKRLKEQEPCEDAISRQAALNSLIDNTHLDGYDLAEALDAIENKEKLPPVTPQYTEAEIQKMQDLEQAEIQKAYEIGKAEKPNKWIPVKWHEITDEEREREGYPKEWACHLDSIMPYDGQRILITTKGGYVELDECYSDDGCTFSLDSGYDWVDDVVAWCELPEPYKSESEGRMQIVIDISEARFRDIQRIAEVQFESKYFKTAEQIIAKGVPIEQESRWIPVSEKLPEDYGEYLITWTTSQGKRPFIGISEGEVTGEYDHIHNRFKFEWLLEDYIKSYSDVEVIAWMPLPKPYEPQESEGEE